MQWYLLRVSGSLLTALALVLVGEGLALTYWVGMVWAWCRQLFVGDEVVDECHRFGTTP